MQINAYNIGNIEQAGQDQEVNNGSIQPAKSKGFFAVAIEKSAISNAFSGDYANYDKNGNRNRGQGKTADTIQEREDAMAYINENIDKLKALITPEDYSAMSELGLAADKETPETLVTVYERIQIQLAAYCKDYDIMSNIGSDKIETVLHSKAMANSVEMAEDSGELTDSSKAYLLKNDLNPTIANVYKAAHSTGENNAAAKVSSEDWEQLKPQIEDMLQKSGLEVNQENLDNAKWLMENSIPVTSENIVKLNELNQVDMSNPDVLTTNIAFALMLGMDGTDAFVTEGWIDVKEADEVNTVIQNASDEAIYDIVRDKAVLNSANLKKYQEQKNSSENSENQTQRDYQDKAFVKAKNIIIEARLVMTSGSFLNMQKVGINITYTEISVMVRSSVQDNQNYYSTFFDDDNPTSDQTDMVAGVMDIMKSMSQVPSAVMGKVYSEKVDFTISSVQNETTLMYAEYGKAEMTYEAVGTQIRPDLGDSIAKAFDSLDNILCDQGIEVNSSTLRAGRILAYNEMEINQESILKMEGLMEELDYVKDNLTPKAAAVLAENQVNILNTDIRQLNKNLSELNSMIGQGEEENFAKYLWKLSESGKISDENRERYIDLYRTLNMIETQDSSALGAVVSAGAELTLDNLLSAVKSRKKTGMDVKIDETFGLNTAETNAKNETNEEIGDFVKKLAQKIRSGLNAENVEKVYKNGSYGGINLGNLVDVVSDNESLRSNSQLNAEYIQQVMESRMEEITLKEGITDETILTLVEGGQKATIENIVSAMQLSVPGSEFRKYLMETEERRDAAENLLEHFDDEESAVEAVKELKNSVLPEKQGNGIDISYEKMKAAADISGNLRFMVRSAKNQTYHIPMDLDGEAVTVRVSFVKNEGEGNVNISMNSQSFGKIDCVIHSVNMVSNVKTEAVVYCENVQTADGIIANRQIFISEAQNIDPSGTYELNVLRKKSENYGKQDNRTAAYKIQNSRDVQNSKVETAYLYKISKSFLKSVKECLKNSR